MTLNSSLAAVGLAIRPPLLRPCLMGGLLRPLWLVASARLAQWPLRSDNLELVQGLRGYTSRMVRKPRCKPSWRCAGEEPDRTPFLWRSSVASTLAIAMNARGRPGTAVILHKVEVTWETTPGTVSTSGTGIDEDGLGEVVGLQQCGAKRSACSHHPGSCLSLLSSVLRPILGHVSGIFDIFDLFSRRFRVILASVLRDFCVIFLSFSGFSSYFRISFRAIFESLSRHFHVIFASISDHFSVVLRVFDLFFEAL